jgi:alanyl aminopeptidase
VKLPPPPPAREDGRLPTTVVPQRVSLTLAIDPTKERFSGSERILVKAATPTSHVVLNAHALHILQASVVVKGERFGGITAARLSHGGLEPEELVVSFDPPIPAGDAALDFTWDAPFSPNLMGLSREQDDGRWYAFTDLEPTHARNVFPSFDEPSFKVPYEVTAIVPHGMTAYANGMELEHADDATRPGTTTFTFAPTPPLPSYLVALAVGNLDAQAAAAGSSPVPLRLLAAKGKGPLGARSLAETGPLVRTLGDYFGIGYPYGKLDLVAVPDFAPGAMENPGLITFREILLLDDPAHSATSVRRTQRLVIAHELAHQWFGDLVTPAWWNDAWLNEGFARWAQTKAVERVHPETHETLDRVVGTDAAMDLDALSTARAVRQPVHTSGDAQEAFDPITYDKGAALLGMIESWVGEEAFRRTLHDYLTAHAWGNTSAPDLFAAFEKASGQPVRAVGSSFVDHIGVPEVTVSLSCDRGQKRWLVELTESAWRPLGSRVDAATTAKGAAWQLPACVRIAGQKETYCVELSAAEPKKGISGSGTCPAYVQPNVGMAGYYRSAISAANARALGKAAASFDTASRLGVLTDTWADVRSGKLPPAVLLDVLPLFDGDQDRRVVEEVVRVLRAVDDTLVDPAARPAFRAYVRARLEGHVRRLGTGGSAVGAPAGTDPDDVPLARAAVLAGLGELAADDKTLKEAARQTDSWLADPSSTDADAAQVMVPLAAHHGDQARLDALAKVAEHGATPEIRLLALRASTQFDDPAVETRALDRLLTDAVRKQDVVRSSLVPAMAYRGSRQVALAWIEEHWDALRGKLTGGLARQAVTAAMYACTAAEREHAAQFFTPRAKDLEGSRRLLAESLETSARCTELRAAAAPAVDRFFHVKAIKEATSATSAKKY